MTAEGAEVFQGTSLATGMPDVPPFDREALIRALRIDQAGGRAFPEFLASAWRARVVGYDVDLAGRTVT